MSLAYPCHAILLAAHCALLEPSPTPDPQLEGFEHRQDITIPFPAAFDVIREFIYTHSSRALMSRLLSIDSGAWSHIVQETEQWEHAAAAFARMGVEEITKRWGKLYEVYEDASSIGLVDDKFWHSIQIASWILARGLNIWREGLAPEAT